MQGNLLYAQSGGVTAVINASACAVIETARKHKVRVLAARNGIIGALREELAALAPATATIEPPFSAKDDVALYCRSAEVSPACTTNVVLPTLGFASRLVSAPQARMPGTTHSTEGACS